MSRFAGQYEQVFETTTAGITIQAPQVHDCKKLFVCLFVEMEAQILYGFLHVPFSFGLFLRSTIEVTLIDVCVCIIK